MSLEADYRNIVDYQSLCYHQDDNGQIHLCLIIICICRKKAFNPEPRSNNKTSRNFYNYMKSIVF